MIVMVKVPRLSSVVPQTPRWRWVTGIVIFAVAYAVLLTAYFYDGRSGAFEGYTDKEPAPGGVLVTMEFDGIDPQNKVLMATIDVDLDAALQDPDAPVAQLVAPKDTLSVIVAPTTDGASLVYPAGQPMTLRQVRIPTEPGSGYIRDWPFDRYPTSIVVLAGTADGKNSLPVDVSFGGSVQGWHVSAEEADPDAPDAALGRVYDVQMRRSLGVVLFGIAIVLVLIALPFLALWVVINVYRGRRKFEPAFLSWIAAMLFATIPIRNFLPGSPPAGSWVDVAVVVWVIIALIVALFFGVGSWWRFGRDSDRPAPAEDTDGTDSTDEEPDSTDEDSTDKEPDNADKEPDNADKEPDGTDNEPATAGANADDQRVRRQ